MPLVQVCARAMLLVRCHSQVGEVSRLDAGIDVHVRPAIAKPVAVLVAVAVPIIPSPAAIVAVLVTSVAAVPHAVGSAATRDGIIEAQVRACTGTARAEA